MSRTVEVRTPGRLHFGLSSFGGEGRHFGGLGVMVDGVGVTLRVTPADVFLAEGPLRERVEHFAQKFAQHQNLSSLPACRLEVVNAPPDHVGLGVGTQLGLAVVAGLAELWELPWRDAALLSQMSGRGTRSAVGTYGFLHGGLIVDNGKLPDEPLGKLAQRVAMPSDWRFVLVRPHDARGLAGDSESNAISKLPAVPLDVTRSLHRLIDDRIVPAARAGDWRQYSKAVYEYGYRAGECFAPAQGGPFASPAIAQIVQTIRDLGFPGAGQSSWGPTVFAVAADEHSAEALVGELRRRADCQPYHFAITQANSTGARIGHTR